MNDSFDTVARDVQVKIAVGACRFIASVSRTDSEAAARYFIAKVSEEFNNATHNVFAYRIGSGDNAICRQSDAGEPAGTAGAPMLQTIDKAGVTNVTVVGTRYFGGVKLGIGGLVRAYRSCAEAGLEQAGLVTQILLQNVTVRVSYEMVGSLLRELPAYAGEMAAIDYGESQVSVRCLLPLSRVESFAEKLQDMTRGRALVTIGHTKD